MRRERGLLGIRSVIEIPFDSEREVRARELEVQGLVTIEEQELVRCVNWGDADEWDVTDRGCGGRIYLSVDDGQYYAGGRQNDYGLDAVHDTANCPRCGREVEFAGKARFRSLVVRRNDEAVRALVRRRIERLGLAWRERPKGMFTIEGEVRDVRVYIVDLRPERAATAPRDQAVIHVRCDEHLLLPQLPEVPTFALEDLARGDDAAFAETLRTMAGEPERYTLFAATKERVCEEAPRSAPRLASGVVARAVTHDGERDLTLGEYEALRASAAKHDLVIDMTAPASGRRVVAGYRAATGEYAPTTLSAGEAAVLCELVVARRAVRPGQLKSLAGVTKERLGKRVEEARAKVDLREKQTWRAFKTIGGRGDAATQYRFDPPAGFRFAVVMPIGEQRAGVVAA